MGGSRRRFRSRGWLRRIGRSGLRTGHGDHNRCGHAEGRAVGGKRCDNQRALARRRNLDLHRPAAIGIDNRLARNLVVDAHLHARARLTRAGQHPAAVAFSQRRKSC